MLSITLIISGLCFHLVFKLPPPLGTFLPAIEQNMTKFLFLYMMFLFNFMLNILKHYKSILFAEIEARFKSKDG